MSWIRKANLSVVSKENLLDLSEMHFTFQTTGSDGESPNTADIKIYNLSRDTSRMIQHEFDQVILQAGYEDENNVAIIFSGTIKQFYVGKENNTDSYLRILAADGDIFHNFGYIETVIPPGTKPQDIVNTLVGKDESGTDIPMDPQNNLGIGGILPLERSKVVIGLKRDYLRDITAMPLLKWSIQNGQFTLIKQDGYLPGKAVEINSATGMVGIPEVTTGGLAVRKLLDPKIRIGYRIHINQGDINQINIPTNQQRDPKSGNRIPGIGYPHYESSIFPADTWADGFYRVLVVEHRGDTRGQDWYTDIISLKLDNPTSLGTAAK